MFDLRGDKIMVIEVFMFVFFLIMEEGIFVKWNVKEGDIVLFGDIIVEIEIDKVMMEFEVVDEGIVGKIVIVEGIEGVKVNMFIVVFVEEGEIVDDVVLFVVLVVDVGVEVIMLVVIEVVVFVFVQVVVFEVDDSFDWFEGILMKI